MSDTASTNDVINQIDSVQKSVRSLPCQGELPANRRCAQGRDYFAQLLQAMADAGSIYSTRLPRSVHRQLPESGRGHSLLRLAPRQDAGLPQPASALAGEADSNHPGNKSSGLDGQAISRSTPNFCSYNVASEKDIRPCQRTLSFESFFCSYKVATSAMHLAQVNSYRRGGWDSTSNTRCLLRQT